MINHKTKLELSSIETVEYLKAFISQQEKERIDIGFQIHENALQLLPIVKWKISKIFEGPEFQQKKNAEISEVLDLLNKISQDLSTTANQLYPPTIKFSSLAVALDSICNSVIKELNIKIDFVNALPQKVILFQIKEQYKIYNLFNEVLSFFISNSECQHLKVSFSVLGNVFFMDIISLNQSGSKKSKKSVSVKDTLNIIRGRLLGLDGFIGADTDWKEKVKIGVPISDSGSN